MTSDDFASGALGSLWTIEGPGGISGTVGATATDGYLELVTPDGSHDAWNANNGARAMQDVATDGDFALATRFLTTPTERYQLQGILVEQDAGNWIRFDTYSDGNKLYAFAATTENGSSAMQLRMAIPGNVAEYLRVTRDGDDWTLEFSQDGVSWTSAGSFSHALTVTSVGVFAGNTGAAEGFTARVDYVEFASDPISDEDGVITPPQNGAPVAGDDAVQVTSDVAEVISVAALLANDSDPDGDPLTLASFTQPANGTLIDNGDGTLTYTPNAGYEGPDSFTYTVSDSGLSDTATVTLTVAAAPPSADLTSDDFASGALGALWTIEGPGGISGAVGATATDGYLELVTPDGSHDAWNANNGARAMQDVATDGDFALTTRFLTTPTERYQLQGVLVEQDAGNWIRFDTYSDGNKLYAFAATTENGSSAMQLRMAIPGNVAEYLRVTRDGDDWTLEFSQDGVSWTSAGSFSHALTVTSVGVFAGNTGAAEGFTARVDYVEFASDPISDEDGVITPPQNGAPVGVDDAVQVTSDVAEVISVAALLANDSDPDGDPLTLASFTQPANGTLVDNGDGTLTYTPNAGYQGPDSFTYTVTDGDQTDTATVNLTVAVEQTNGAPVATDDAVQVAADTIEVIVVADLLANDSDPDGDPLTLASFTQPANGTLFDNGDGTLTYTPNVGYEGPDSFSYTVSDGDLSDSATVALTVAVPPPSSDLTSDDFAAGSGPWPGLILSPGSGGPGNELSFVGTDRAVVADLSTGTYAYAARVMPSGDSLTVGVINGTEPEETLEGYRLDLFENVISAGGWIDYVGGASNGPAELMDTQHAALQGARATGAAGNGVTGPADVSDATAAHDPDIALMMFGTNDISDATDFPILSNGNDALSSIMSAFDDLVSQFFANADPGAYLVVSSIAPRIDRGREAVASEYFNEGYSIVNGAPVVGDAGNGTYVPGLIAKITDLQSSYPSLLLFENPHAEFQTAGDAASLDHLSSDGLHWTQEAYAEYAAELYAFLEDEIGLTGGTLGGTAQGIAAAVTDLYGSDVGDRLVGDAGDNRLNGGGGADLLEGGAGADTFVLDSSALVPGNADRIVDFNAAEGDTIDASAIVSHLGLSAAQAELAFSYAETSAGVKLMLTHGGATYTLAVLSGVELSDIGVLDPVWDIESPQGTSASVGANASDAWLSLETPDGSYDIWNDNNAVRAMQATTDADFQIETRFLTTPTEKFQIQGILVEQDAENWIRLDTYSDGNTLYAFAATTVNGVSAIELRVAIPEGTAEYLRVTRSGDTWTLEYSQDGATFVSAGSFNHALTVTAAGVFAGNTDLATGFTAEVDYVEISSDPISNEDGTLTGPSNVAPVAEDDAFSVTLDTAEVISIADLLANDSDLNGDTLTLASFTQPANGTLIDNGDGTLTYTPDTGFEGPDSFSYTVTDGDLSDTATVALTVASAQANGAPVAGDDAVQVTSDVAEVISVAALLANDSDPDGDPLTLASFTQPANGTLIDNGDGTLTYTPNAGYEGPDSFTYTVTDGDLSDTATVTLTVAAAPPSADLTSDDFASGALGSLWTIEGPGGISGTVGATATDGYLELVTPDGSHDAWNANNGARAMQDVATDGDFALATRFLTTPTERYQLQGILVEQDAGNWIRFDTYSDGNKLYAFAATTENGSSAMQLRMAIPGNVAEYLRVTRDGDDWTLEFSQDGVNWTSAGSFSHALTVTSVGVFAGNTGAAEGFTARVDYVEFASDPISNEDGVITPPQNGAPVAGDDAVQVTSDVAEVISVAALLANDSDPDGDPLTLASFTQPANGTLIDNGDGTLTYTPNAGYEGPDSFTYTVTDGDQTDTATVNLTVAVTANLVSDDFSAGTLDPAWTFSGIDGDAALGTSQTDAFVTLTSPQGVPVSASGPLSTPRLMQSTNDGNFQIEAGFLTEPSQLFQEHGLLVYQDASTWIRFDLAYTSLGLSIIVGVISGGSPDYRVFDEVDTGSVSQFRITRNGDDWQFETSADGSAWTLVYSMTHTMVVSEVGLFTGSAEYNGQVPGYAAQVDYFETASDPIVNEDAGFAPINTAPDGVDDAMTAYVDTPLVIDAASDLLGNDSDPQGDPLTVVAVTQPANGTLIDNGDGTYTYTPDAGFEGTDSFQYTVSDGDLTDVATVTVNVSQPGAGITSDDFSTNSLDPIWTIEGPSGISGAVTGDPTDGFLELVTPDGSYDVWNTNNGARAMQAVPDEDFTVEVKFLTTPTERFQIQGLLVEGDAQNWLRFDTYTDGNKLYAFAASTVNGTSSMELRVTIPEGTAEYLQLTRSGDLWTFAYSQDGVSWTSAGSFNHAIAATAAGVFAGNVGNATGYTARVDYFESSTDPITNEDGDYVELNNPPDALDDFLTITHGQPLTFSIADLLANDSDQNEDPLSFDGFTQPANGTLVDNGDGTLTYTPNAGYEGPDSFEYTISDGELSSTATVTMREVIDLWYGETQTFGAPGEAQTWVNILGNVASDVTDLSYSLNGGAAVDLVIGPDTRRLQESGDFNIDIAYADLDGSAAVDVVTIIATLLDGSTVTQDVTVAYEDGAVWDANYAIDWDTVTNIQDVVQVVDGDWSIQNGGLRLNQLGYDRVVAFGDESWDNYELQMSVTTHDLTNIDPNGRDGGGFAIGMLWTGHTDDPISGFQPKAGWEPGAAFFYTNNDGVGAGKFALHPSENFFWTLDSKTMTLEEDVTYNIVVRVEQTNIYDRTYQIKIWEEGTSEPTAWTLEGTQTFGLDQEPATGSIYLNAHYQDVTFNDLSVVEITGDDIVKGTEGADVLAAVDTTSGTPGRDEIDVFVGYGGADVFVFGDADGDYYDDGDGATGGLDDYAFIYDFNASEDAVQLAGTENDYVLATDTAGLSPGTSVWRAGTAGDEDELVGVINDVYGLSLAGDEFIFAGDAIA